MKDVLSEFGDVFLDVDLRSYNTFRISSQCKYMVFPKTQDDVLRLLLFLNHEKIPYFLIGNGSNIILLNDFYEGVFVSLKYFNEIVYEKNQVTVGAGVMMPKFSMNIIEHGFQGFEWASGIPGTVGGCIYGNAEAYKESTFDSLQSVLVVTPDLELKTIDKESLSYGYRTSFFKEHPGYIILQATFLLKSGNSLESMDVIIQRKKKRMSTQPLEYPSAGSVFRNPSVELPSGKIIEDLGLKGLKSGGAEVSQKHANFIINRHNATGKDIESLVELIKEKVKMEYHIDLVMEQEYVGWD